MRALIIGIATALGLAASVQAQNADDRYGAWAARGQTQVQARLSAPARFGRVVVSFYSGHHIVCGYVNSQRFVWAGSSINVLEQDMASGEMNSLWTSLCSAVVYVARP